LISVFWLLPALTEAQQSVKCPSSGPLSEAQLTGLVRGSVPATRIAQLVASCGIDFEPTGGAIGRLRSLGAPRIVLDAVRAAAGPAERKRQAEQALWESIKGSQEAESFEEYLHRYPKGLFEEPAIQALRRLRIGHAIAAGETAIAAHDWDGAAAEASRLRELDPENAELARWESQIATTREAIRKAEADRAALAQREEAEKQRLATEEEARRLHALELAKEFVAIPAGKFVRGPGSGNQIQITKGFEIGKYEVTQAEWEAVMGRNPSHFKGADRPVESVSWEDAQKFLTRLNGKEDGYLYRLPSEAEWEYAARAGTPSENSQNLEALAWFDGNSGGQTHAVGQRQANAWGLHDMLGNVWEWCNDWYGESSSQGKTRLTIDPRGPLTGTARILRGGSWGNSWGTASVTVAVWREPSFRDDIIGFRCVRERRATISTPPKPSAQDKTAKRADAAFDRKDYRTAVPLYQQLADSRRGHAMNRLGYLYENGLGLAQSDFKAFVWYRKAAENGDPEGMFNLGKMYDAGRGVGKDDTQAVTWYRKAAQFGDPQGMNIVGAMYANGQWVSRDDAQAVTWFRKAAEKGDPQGMNNLGAMYDAGRGVAKDDNQALAWYRKAADKGNPNGMNNLAMMYANGQGVRKDDTQAVAWFRKAAENGSPAGMYHLGWMYAHGQGVAQDDTQAVAWFRQAAEKGESEGMTYLGAMYENGSGVEQDHSQALAWYRKAAALGDEDAKASLKRMETPRKSKKGTTRKDPTK
jgi:TPR repeat protein/formylglycine-generating enzyme required for sulfatase activity